MARNNQKRASYSIEATTYIKRPTGKTNNYGHKEYERVGTPERTYKTNTNFSELKKDLYEKSKSNKNMFVAYTRPVYRIRKCRPRVKSVTVRLADGTKKVTYYNAVKK